MPLIDCPACGHRISSEAVACPQCGHPNRPAQSSPAPQTGPTCCRCSALATTRCQGCNMFCCPRHVQSIYVQHGRGGANELRCPSCYESAMTLTIFGFVFAAVVVVIMLIVVTGMSSR
ncbi:zinc-ribbon domain-containing protein [Gemmata sp. G18]|uniref:Zinc-ribbon domain-containing protein n=1 Tax=Gemmata palustris TaxID=2822762 RepID=A0ABS5C2X9_9BACT|nr:zinc-ribbon domain-containing protein [Gemmata palustris]